MRNLILLLFILLVAFGFSQESPIKKRWTINGSWSKLDFVENNPNFKMDPSKIIHLELNYGISKNIELGLYSGLSFNNFSKTLHGGIQANYHILPLFIDAKDFRFDAYLCGKYGVYRSEYAYMYTDYLFSYEYSLGAGAAFYLFKHLGVFYEYHLGNFFGECGHNHLYTLGLTFKFRKRK